MKGETGIFHFTHGSGLPVYQYELNNKKGTLVGITNYGAIINYFKLVKDDGTVNDIVHGFDKLEDYLGETYLAQYPWFGCVVGRYANRIRNASFELDGKTYYLTKNNGKHQLHGGPAGFDRRVWEFVDQQEGDPSWIKLKYYSKDGEEGYPGNLEVEVVYELNDNDEFSYTLTATCDKACPVNLTHHGYFNLNNNLGTIHDHKLVLYCSKILDQDADLVATGVVSDVEGTPFDFRVQKSIGQGLQQVDEYDKSFVRYESGYGIVAEVHCAASNTHLYIYSTEPIVHFYSGKWTPLVKGKEGIEYGPFSGLCLETHKHPNAVNIPHFPDTILRPGDVYRQRTTYKVVF